MKTLGEQQQQQRKAAAAPLPTVDVRRAREQWQRNKVPVEPAAAAKTK